MPALMAIRMIAVNQTSCRESCIRLKAWQEMYMELSAANRSQLWN